MSLYLEMHRRWDMSRLAFPDCTYADLHQEVLNTVNWLREQGVQRGDVICVQLPKSRRLLRIILAGIAMGAPVLPLHERYTTTEIQYYVEDVQATLSILIVDLPDWQGRIVKGDALPEIFPLALDVELPQDIRRDDLALLLYTSGTTGKPKGAMISHGNLLSSISALHTAWEWQATDRLLHMLPLFHVHGLVVAQFGALYANAYTEWMPAKWSASDVVERWAASQISICMMVPTIVYRVIQVEDVPPLSSLRLCTSGSAPLPVSTHEAFEQKFGRSILERYGMTEVGIVLSNPYSGERRPGTVGFPLGDMRFRVVNAEREDVSIDEIGELLISGPSVISGYWNQPEATTQTIQDGWLASGDLATLDADGYYSIVGRSKDLIISGGFNVYPKEIERGLLTLDGVQEVAVVGIPDDEWGESVVAVVIGNVTWDVVRAWSLENLAPYKRPKKLVLVEDFPRNAMGKIQKAQIRESLARND